MRYARDILLCKVICLLAQTRYVAPNVSVVEYLNFYLLYKLHHISVGVTCGRNILNNMGASRPNAQLVVHTVSAGHITP